MCYWESVVDTENRREILDQAREEIRAARRAMMGEPAAIAQGPVSFESQDAADSWLSSTPELNPALTDDQNEALREYKADHFFEINDDLRQGGYSDQETSGGADIQEAIDEVFTNLPGTQQDITVYRGMSYDVFEDEEDLTGDVVQDDAYVSASLRRRVAEGFSDGTIVEIRMPQGTRAINMERWKVTTGSESELLLPRESKFRVISDTGADDDVRKMIWELIL